MDGGQGVELDSVSLQHLEAGHHAVERGPGALVDAVGVVQMSGAVDADADENVVLAQEAAPGVIEQHPIRLQGVRDSFALGMLGLERHCGLVEFDTEQGGFAALPGETDFVPWLGGNIVADVRFQHRRRHPLTPRVSVERLFLQIKTIRAIEIAGRPGRLGHEMKRSVGGRSHETGPEPVGTGR